MISSLIDYIGNIGGDLGPYSNIVTILSASITVFIAIFGSLAWRVRKDKTRIKILQRENKRRQHDFEKEANRADRLEEKVISLRREIDMYSAPRVIEIYETKKRLAQEISHIHLLSDWFSVSRNSIGMIGQLLAEHYVSYAERETGDAAMIKSRQMAILASVSLEDRSSINALIHEIGLVDESNNKNITESEFQQIVDSAESFDNATPTIEVAAAVEAALESSERHHEKGMYFVALYTARRAHRLAEKLLPLHNQTRFDAIDRMVFALFTLKMFAQAEILAREVLNRRVILLGADKIDLGLALSYNNVASQLVNQSKGEEAIPFYEKAIYIRSRLLGPKHVDTRMVQSNMGFLYQCLNMMDKAREMFRSALCDEKPRDDLNEALLMNNYGIFLLRVGENDQALPILQAALRIRCRLLGRKHPDTALSMRSLAEAFLASNNLDEAALLSEEASPIIEKAYGPKSAVSGSASLTLGRIYIAKGNYSKAKDCLEKIFDVEEVNKELYTKCLTATQNALTSKES